MSKKHRRQWAGGRDTTPRSRWSVCTALLLLATAIPAWLFGQSPSDLQQLNARFKDEGAVMLKNREALKVKVEGDGLHITNSFYSDKMIIDASSQGLADEFIYYNNTFDNILEIDATAFLPKGNKYRKKKVDRIETKSKLSGSIFYHDNKYKHIVFPRLEEGGRAVLSYKQEVNDPHFLGSFYFSSYIPTLDAEYSISFPKNVKVRYKVFNDFDGKIRFRQEQEGSNTVYTWSASDVAKFETDSDAPSLSYYEPHVVVYIEEYTINGQRQNVLSDVGGLYAWYRSLVEDVNTAVSPEIRQLSDSLTGGLSTDREKVQAVFDWVQDNIKYVAFEDGMSGFIPREASKVCSKRYGDCKDMTSITTELLKAANIPAYLTWIGSRDIPYSYSELPTPMVDNHMIAAVKLDGEFVFLDATSQYTPIGFPTAFIQGKEALVGVGSENFELVQVPEVAMERNSYRDSIVLEVNGAEVIGTAEARFSGYQKVDMVRPFNARPVNKQKDFIQARLIKGHNKFRLDDFSVTGADNKATDFQVDYRFTVPDYAKNIGSAVYINLNLDKTLYNEQIDPQVRKLPIEVKYKTVEEFITDLRIPEGYRVDYLPKDQEFRNEAFGFSMQYRQEDGRVILTKRIYSNTLVVQPEQFEAWNQMIESIDQAYNEVVVLKQ